MTVATLYFHSFVVARIVVNVLAVLAELVLFERALAFRYDMFRHQATTGRLMAGEWSGVSFMPISEFLLLLVAIWMLFGSIALLHVAKPEPWAQVWQMLALVTLVVRGLAAVWSRRQGFGRLQDASKSTEMNGDGKS